MKQQPIQQGNSRENIDLLKRSYGRVLSSEVAVIVSK